MKVCPICSARAFDDAEVCFGCLHHFDADAPAIPDGCAAVCVPDDAQAGSPHGAAANAERPLAQARARAARSHEDAPEVGAFGPLAGSAEAQECCPGDGVAGGLLRSSPLECLMRRMADGAIAFRLNAPSLVSLGGANEEDAGCVPSCTMPLMRVPAGAWVRIGAVEETGGL